MRVGLPVQSPAALLAARGRCEQTADATVLGQACTLVRLSLPSSGGTPGPYSLKAHQSHPIFLSSEHRSMTSEGVHTIEVALPESIAALSSQRLICDANGKSLKQVP